MLSPVPRHQRAHLVVPAAFSADECDRIVSLCEPEPAEPATLEGVEHVGTTRSSSVSWLPADEDTWWIYDRLGELAVDANEHWGFELVGFEEELQYTRYDGPGDHYAWHRDGLDGAVSTRKLSIVVQLTPPEHYAGGRRGVQPAGHRRDVPRLRIPPGDPAELRAPPLAGGLGGWTPVPLIAPLSPPAQPSGSAPRLNPESWPA